jgi:ribosome-associated translation inhibitor RaiA
MTIEIRGRAVSLRLQADVSRTLTDILKPLTVKPVAARATFFDDNGPKGGPAVRCALTIRLPYRPHLRAEATGVTARLAFDASLARLHRELERYRERDRDNKRRPKKYYVAKLTTETEPAATSGGSPGPAGTER